MKCVTAKNKTNKVTRTVKKEAKSPLLITPNNCSKITKGVSLCGIMYCKYIKKEMDKPPEPKEAKKYNGL